MTPEPDIIVGPDIISGWEITRTITGIVAIIVTTLGILAALWISGRASRDRKTERKEDQSFEALMFRVRGTGYSTGQEEGHEGKGPTFHFYVEHHGPQPVFDVRYQYWPGGMASEEQPLGSHLEIALPGEDVNCSFSVPPQWTTPTPGGAWRVTWRDRYGNHWVVDRDNQEAEIPRRFTPGEAPRRR
jgi:hypothetical protein